MTDFSATFIGWHFHFSATFIGWQVTTCSHPQPFDCLLAAGNHCPIHPFSCPPFPLSLSLDKNAVRLTEEAPQVQFLLLQSMALLCLSNLGWTTQGRRRNQGCMELHFVELKLLASRAIVLVLSIVADSEQFSNLLRMPWLWYWETLILRHFNTEKITPSETDFTA